MEKYTNYRDKGTGISPFIPVNPTRHGKLYKILQWIVFIVKCLLLLPVLLCLLGVSFNGSMIYLLMKLLFGYSVDVTVQGKRKRAINKRVDYPHRGLLYLCNYTSALDAIVCYIISQDTNVLYLVVKDNEVYGMRLYNFLNYSLGQVELVACGEKINNWQEVCNDYTCFLFAEGTTSNGKSVLPFEIDVSHLQSFIAGEDETVATASTTNARVKNKFSEVIQWVQIRHIPSSLTTPLPITKPSFLSLLLYISSPQTKVKLVPSSETGGKSQDLVANGRTLLNGGRTPVARTLGAAQKAAFLAEWRGARA